MRGSRHSIFALSLLGGVFCGALAFLPTQAAVAGFQWTAPSDVASAQPSVPAVPATPVTREMLPSNLDDLQTSSAISTTPDGPASAAPIYGNGMSDDPISWNTPAAARPPRIGSSIPLKAQPVAKPTPTQMQQSAAQASMPANNGAPTSLYTYSAKDSASAAPATLESDYDVAEGFGRDLPLVMAIRQIVPARFGFVFDDGIDLSSHVSWQGGKAWNIVLQETLAPLGLYPDIRGNVISVIRSGGARASQLQASASTQISSAVEAPSINEAPVATMQPTPVAMVPAAPQNITNTMPAVQPAVSQGHTTTRHNLRADLSARTMWSAPRNSTLRTILENWSARVGVELYWASEYDYPIQTAVKIEGTFEQAVQTLLKGLFESHPRPIGRLHPNLPEGPAVLVIETRQNAL